MIRRGLSTALINALKPSQLWLNLVSDRDLQPEIRDDAISVYYRGGALIRNLRLECGSLVADIHQKFVPLQASGPRAYLRLASNGAEGLAFEQPPQPLQFGIGEASTLEVFKGVMERVLTSPEFQIVQAICSKPENQVLDQEIAFQQSGESRDKIDLCYFDSAIEKLVFVEVKRVDDPRLFSKTPEALPEVLEQLNSYSTRLRKHRDTILATYTQVALIKRELGLGHRIMHVPFNGLSDLLERPVLVIGNCEEHDVQEIFASAERWRPLREGLTATAAALILCGKNGCRLNLTKGRQTLLF